MEKWFQKIAVITGASTCIGQQIVSDLSKAGLNVIGLTRKKHVIESLSRKHKSNPGSIHGMECDISKPDAIKNAFKRIENQYGGVHVMINNAGKIKRGETLDAKSLVDEEIISTINFSLTGVVLCTREAFKLMQKNNNEHGYIININCLVGTALAADKKIYSNVYLTSKYAVKNHTETVRLDLAVTNNKFIKVTVSKKYYRYHEHLFIYLHFVNEYLT